MVIGISDKKRTLEGINFCGNEKINDFINAPKDCCRPMPRYREDFLIYLMKQEKLTGFCCFSLNGCGNGRK